MRFRAEALTFVVSGAEAADQVLGEGGASEATLGTIAYPRLKKTLTNEKSGSSFTLNVEPGSFNGAEILGLLPSGVGHILVRRVRRELRRPLAPPRTARRCATPRP